MFSNKPYLIRAFYEWIVDNQCTPFVVINASYPRCNVPDEYVENGEITLNISPSAIRDLKIKNDLIEFRASFSGVVHIVSAPIKSVLAIYAQENQQGMFFDYEDMEEQGEGDSGGAIAMQPVTDTFNTNQISDAKKEKSKAHLKLVE